MRLATYCVDFISTNIRVAKLSAHCFYSRLQPMTKQQFSTYKVLPREMVQEELRDDQASQYFLYLLINPNSNKGDRQWIEGILNGSFVFRTECTKAFHFCPKLFELGVSSKSLQCLWINCFLWDCRHWLVEEKVRYNSCDVLAKFLLVWAAMDVSIMPTQFSVILPLNQEMITFFRSIFTELRKGVPLSLSEQDAPSPFEGGKDITTLWLSLTYKLGSVLVNGFGNGEYIPPRKAACLCRHSANLPSKMA